MATKNSQNFTEVELGWIEAAASIRRAANVEALVNSFLCIFWNRARHAQMTPDEIRVKLTSRVMHSHT